MHLPSITFPHWKWSMFVGWICPCASAAAGWSCCRGGGCCCWNAAALAVAPLSVCAIAVDFSGTPVLVTIHVCAPGEPFLGIIVVPGKYACCSSCVITTIRVTWLCISDFASVECGGRGWAAAWDPIRSDFNPLIPNFQMWKTIWFEPVWTLEIWLTSTDNMQRIITISPPVISSVLEL